MVSSVVFGEIWGMHFLDEHVLLQTDDKLNGGESSRERGGFCNPLWGLIQKKPRVFSYGQVQGDFMQVCLTGDLVRCYMEKESRSSGK